MKMERILLDKYGMSPDASIYEVVRLITARLPQFCFTGRIAIRCNCGIFPINDKDHKFETYSTMDLIENQARSRP